MLNFAAVQFYGEAEFWLSGGKVLLIFILFAFTLFTMSGANPQHDAYGFRHFSSPSPFATYLSEGPLGRLEGFVACLSNAAITIVGPEYISMIAAEAKHPSIYVKSAYETVYYRFCAFFILGALSVGIILRCDDKALRETWLGGGDTGSASASPYVLAMSNMGIGVLPHIVNALILTSIFSAGNTYIYSATRALYSLALEGRAPRALRYCNSRGIPVYCFLVVMLFPFLSFLQVANSSATVLTFLAGLITSGILVNFIVISLTFLNYYRACQVQSVDRTQRPYYGRFQPYGSYIALVCQVIILFGCGYTAFRPKWDAKLFIQNYGMPILDSILFVGWKLMKKTSLVRPADMDLIWERPGIDAYEQLTTEPVVSFWTEILQLFGFRRHPGRDAEIATAR